MILYAFLDPWMLLNSRFVSMNDSSMNLYGLLDCWMLLTGRKFSFFCYLS